MARSTYSAEFKAKIVIEVIEGAHSLEEIAATNQLNPNMVRAWKKEFLERASIVFDNKAAAKEEKRREEEQKKEKARMLKAIGQLTLERDFLQDCFRRTGRTYTMPDFSAEEE